MVSKVTCVVLTALFFSGCAPRPVSTAAHADPNLQITLTTQPPSPRQMDPTRFTVTLRDAHSLLVRRAKAQLSLQMTTMDMGQDIVALSPQSPGVYTGTGRFTMSGAWRAAVTARQGKELTVQSFPITVQ